MKKINVKIICGIILLIMCFGLVSCGAKEKEYDFYKVKSITEDKIDRVEVSYADISARVLSKDEVQTLIGLISNSGDDVQQYNGPDPKGVTNSLDVYLKSKSCFSMYPYRNGYLLFCGEKSYIISQPQYNDFIKDIFNSKGKI
ncbi:hypothetical protein [Clostridium folliculivorans]|uniref:Lipoprotein n=1 Tax=Clostridium folliculivorans TaxID=2886038 RepID=A0A9W5Y6X3_9CLOT|nr:hypothetical protein [Clostridium folliculivorans]GKU27695.1 hypothetical protein CFOLD11_45220 [Clostridium folliculivorans]GKU32455.1 hypothetical protein CFB3_45630 [Clostridium folliculivorans]